MKRLGAVAVLLLAAAALFAPYPLRGERFLCAATEGYPPWFAPPGTPAPGPADYTATDQLVFMLPNDVHRARSLRSDFGGLFWNPHALCGTPFLATQDTFALYPPSLIALAVSPEEVFFWTAALHVLIAALGAYAALGRLDLGLGARHFGAVAFAAGPWMLVRLDYPNLPQTAAWTPWIFYAADRAAVLRRTRDRALLAAVVALSAFAGMIQITLVTLVGAGLLALVRAAALARTEGALVATKGLASAAVGVLVGVLFAAPQWLVTWDYARDGSRIAAGLDDLRPRCVRPAEWLSILSPDVFGSGPEINRRTLDGSLKDVRGEEDYPPAKALGLRHVDATFFESAFAPFAAATVALLAGGFRRRGVAVVGLLLFAFGALAASDSPLFALVHGAPGAAFGSPRRWLLLAAAGGALLAAAGLDATPTRGGRLRAAALPLVLGLAWAALRLFPDGLAPRLAAAADVSDAAARTSLDVLAAGIGVSAAFAAAATAALFAPPRVRGALLLLLLVGEGVAFQLKHNPGQATRPVFPPTRTVAALRGGTPADAPTEHRMARVLGDDEQCRKLLGVPPTPFLLAQNTPTIYGIRDVQGYEGVLNRGIEEVFEALEPGVVKTHHRVETFSDPRVATSPVLDFLGVRHVLSQRASLEGLAFRGAAEEERLAWFENGDRLPTETCVASARLFDDPRALLAALVAPDFDPTREALLLRADAEKLGLPPPDASGRVVLGDPAAKPALRVDRRRSAEVVATVVLDPSGSTAGRLFVFAETFDPGWSCTTESGEELPVVRANHAFQAAYRPTPPLRITRSYRPRLWYPALGLALCGLVALKVDSRVRRRTSPPAPTPHEAT